MNNAHPQHTPSATDDNGEASRIATSDSSQKLSHDVLPELGETAFILGIPVDNLTLSEAIGKIFDLVDQYRLDQTPKYVATVNVDFVVNTLSWIPGRTSHPELLDILRKSDLVTADGMPLVWTARLLGTRLKERVTGADLVPALAETAADKGKSIYLLGGAGDVSRQAADTLLSWFPGLVVAGTSAPFVHVTGEKMLTAADEDLLVVEEINRTAPDILFLGFGNPKQEIWFQRNRHRLKVPVSIGIGGTYEFITGRTRRAPAWIQKSGFEWVYRITQDPFRLFNRYFKGFFKFGTMILPSILYLKYRTWRLTLSGKKVEKKAEKDSLPPQSVRGDEIEPGSVNGESATDGALHFSGKTDLSVHVLALPPRMDSAWVETDGPGFLTRVMEHNVILDFSRVDFMDSTGIGFLVKLYRRFEKQKKRLILCAIQPPIMRTFKLIRVIDLFGKYIVDSVEVALDHFSRAVQEPGFYYFGEENSGVVTLHLFGHLDSERIANDNLGPASFLSGKKISHCILNLKELVYVENSAVFLFLSLQKALEQTGRSLVLCGVQGKVRQMLKISKVEHLFTIAADPAAARKLL